MANPTLQQYIEQQNNPWRKDNPTNSDYFQMITQQNMRDGMSQGVAESNAVQEMQVYMREGIDPMGPINGREAGYNELQGSQLNRDGKVWQQQQDDAADKLFGQQVGQAINYQAPAAAQAQGIADKYSQKDIMESFDRWRTQQNLAPVGLPSGNNKGWGKANEAMQNLRNLEKPTFKR